MRRKLLRPFWLRLPPLAYASLTLAACTGEVPESNSLRPAWMANQVFHLESSYKSANLKTERAHTHEDIFGTVSLGEEIEFGEEMEVGDRWDDAVVWRYQVIHQNFLPPEGDDFYEYATKGGTESPLTVIKASLDPSMNLDHPLVDADPKVYMVIREDRLRMAGLVTFITNQAGDRVSEAITVDDEQMNRSYNWLSQSNLGMVPHFVPPFPIAPENKDVVLEDGQLVNFVNADDAGVDVVYDNLIDGSLITERWEDGAPWALESETPLVRSRLMDPAEVEDLGFDEGEDKEDLDYIELLKTPVNLTESLSVEGLVGNSDVAVREQWTPWAGSWWRQSEGALVFGTANGGETVDTISDLGRDLFTPDATDVQNLGSDLRDLDKGSDEYTEKVDEYRTKQKALVQNLVDYYNAVRAAIDGGRIRMENRGAAGNADWFLVANANWNDAADAADGYPAFEFRVDSLSPMDKFALLQHANGSFGNNNPWFIGAWELLNHWSPAGSGWWGHCNGWAAAAIMSNEPRESHPVDVEWIRDIDYNADNGFHPREFTMNMTVGDQKGLLSETYYSQLSNFFGERYNGEEQDITDLSPKAVLQLLSTYIKQRQVPLVFDTDAGDQVWNFPAFRYELELDETTPGGAGGVDDGKVNINTAGKAELMTLWNVGDWRAERIIAYREAHGPFQTVDEFANVSGIGNGNLNRNRDRITVDMTEKMRTFQGILTVYTRSDGVPYEHLDQNRYSGPDKDVEEFSWGFSLEASPSGEIVSGTWDEEDDHPDFAWVPYTNTVRSGRSENNFLPWMDLLNYLPEELIRR